MYIVVIKLLFDQFNSMSTRISKMLYLVAEPPPIQNPKWHPCTITWHCCINSTAYFWSNHLHQSWFLESIPQKRRPPKMSVISRRIYLSEFPNKIILLFNWWCGTKIDDEDGNINNHFIIIMSPHSVTKLSNFV